MIIIMKTEFRFDTEAYDAGYKEWTNYDPEIRVEEINPYKEFNSRFSWEVGWYSALEDYLEEISDEHGNAITFVRPFDCNEVLPF